MHYSLDVIDRLVHALSPILFLFYYLIFDTRHYSTISSYSQGRGRMTIYTNSPVRNIVGVENSLHNIGLRNLVALLMAAKLIQSLSDT